MALFTRTMAGIFRKTASSAVAEQEVASVIHPKSRGSKLNLHDDFPELPRFQSTAADQAGGRNGERYAAIRAKLRRAFTPSQPVGDSRMFAGRKDILKRVIRHIEDQRLHIVLYGERGIGKTSLLHMLTQAAHEARYIVVYTSCGANSTFDETFRAASADIPLLFHAGFAPTAAEAEGGQSLADLLPADPLSPRKFGDLCAKLTGTRVLIILDEFDRCESGAFRRDVAELIKNLSDRLGRVQLVLAGVAGDLSELVEHIPSIRRNIFAMEISKMPDNEIQQIIDNGERASGLTFDPASSALVIAVAQGSPYIANLLCHHASHTALDKTRSIVTPPDVAVAVDQALDEFQARIAKSTLAVIVRLTERGFGEAMALAAKAATQATDGQFTAADVAGGGEISQPEAQQILDFLLKEKLMTQMESDQGKRYAFTEDGLPPVLWMKRAKQNAFNASMQAAAPDEVGQTAPARSRAASQT